MLKIKRMDCGIRGDIMKRKLKIPFTEKWFLKQRRFIEDNLDIFHKSFTQIKDIPTGVFLLSKKGGILYADDSEVYYYHNLLKKIVSFEKRGESKLYVLRIKRRLR